MKAAKRTTKKTGHVRTTVGELIASVVDVVGLERARVLLADRSLLEHLRQRLVIA